MQSWQMKVYLSRDSLLKMVGNPGASLARLRKLSRDCVDCRVQKKDPWRIYLLDRFNNQQCFVFHVFCVYVFPNVHFLYQNYHRSHWNVNTLCGLSFQSVGLAEFCTWFHQQLADWLAQMSNYYSTLLFCVSVINDQEATSTVQRTKNSDQSITPSPRLIVQWKFKLHMFLGNHAVHDLFVQTTSESDMSQRFQGLRNILIPWFYTECSNKNNTLTNIQPVFMMGSSASLGLLSSPACPSAFALNSPADVHVWHNWRGPDVLVHGQMIGWAAVSLLGGKAGAQWFKVGFCHRGPISLWITTRGPRE